MPVGAVRILCSAAVSSAVLAALAKPPLPEAARDVVVLVLGTVAAMATRSSLLLLAARRGLLVVDAGAPSRHRLLAASVLAGAVGCAVAALLLAFPADYARAQAFVAGRIGAVVGTALATRDAKPKAPRTTTPFRWLVLDTALPSGVIAGLLGTCIAFLRLHSDDVVAAGDLARHLGTTTFLYAFFLGLGGFFKAYGEQTAGLVVVEKTKWNVPNPLFVGGVVGVALLLVVARFVPPLPLATAIVVKASVSLVMGATLSLLGAIQGAKAASLGLKRTRSGPAPPP